MGNSLGFACLRKYPEVSEILHSILSMFLLKMANLERSKKSPQISSHPYLDASRAEMWIIYANFILIQYNK